MLINPPQSKHASGFYIASGILIASVTMVFLIYTSNFIAQDANYISVAPTSGNLEMDAANDIAAGPFHVSYISVSGKHSSPNY